MFCEHGEGRFKVAFSAGLYENKSLPELVHGGLDERPDQWISRVH
jgi:hypothetical protein